MQLRLLAAKPREVKLSKELVVPDEIREEYEFFKSAVESGERLLPFMSKSIVDVMFKDKMIYDWGLYHFHLATGIDPSKGNAI